MNELSISWAHRFDEYRDDLLRLANSRLSELLSRRVSPEDIVQETLKNACKRSSFFEQKKEIPDIRKLQIILEQTICAMERRYLLSAKRDLYKEVEPGTSAGPGNFINQCIDSMAGPFTMAVRQERLHLIQQAIEGLRKNDREILAMRVFQGRSNQECAAALGVSEKNASIRFVRAVQRLQAKLSEYTQC